MLLNGTSVVCGELNWEPYCRRLSELPFGTESSLVDEMGMGYRQTVSVDVCGYFKSSLWLMNSKFIKLCVVAGK